MTEEIHCPMQHFQLEALDIDLYQIWDGHPTLLNKAIKCDDQHVPALKFVIYLGGVEES